MNFSFSDISMTSWGQNVWKVTGHGVKSQVVASHDADPIDLWYVGAIAIAKQLLKSGIPLTSEDRCWLADLFTKLEDRND